ncbi:MAG: hypothetical protein WCF30_04595 [Terracidiphilus sp.]
MPTVYVFGAGASRDAGYPLASQMGGALFEYMLKSENVSIRASAEFLIDTFRETRNIEDLITEIESQVVRLKDSEVSEDRIQRNRIGNRRGYLGVALQEWFRQIHLLPAGSYAIFAEHIVRPGDVVVTFNYDDSLERELRRFGKWDISRGYGFPLGMEDIPSDVLVLKLHGSVNWLVSLFGGATEGTFLVNPPSSMGRHPVIHRADLEFLGYETFSGHMYQSGGAFPCLILPGRSKEFFFDTSFGYEFGDFWDHLWSLAARALKAANKIVVCGYSLPSADQRARDLLFRRPQRKAEIEIVSGDQSERIAREFTDAGFKSASTFGNGYFVGWCQANQTTSAPDAKDDLAATIAASVQPEAQ